MTKGEGRAKEKTQNKTKQNNPRISCRFDICL